MAISKAKRSVRKKQSTRRIYQRQVVRFPEAKGKIVEAVELFTATDYHAISINFQDKTCLHFSLETGLMVKADYSDWKNKEQRMIRKWPAVQITGDRR